MVVGAVGPWFRLFGAGVSGVEGDGLFVLIAGGLALGLLLLYDRRAGDKRLIVVVAIMGLIGFALTSYDGIQFFIELQGDAGEAAAFLGEDLVGIGWGLVVAWLASGSLGIAALLGLRARSRSAPASAS
jgi:hypothetical protein